MRPGVLVVAVLGFLTLVVSPPFSPSLSAQTARYGETLCGDPRFDCVEVQKGDTWNLLWPDSYERDVVKRINRMNVRLRKGMILAVPKKLDKDAYLDLSPFDRRIDPPGRKTVLVDLSKLAWGAYDAEGRLESWGPASGGRGWCRDIHGRCRTPDGEFSALYKGGPKCKSGTFPIGRGGAPMPYCMFFRRGYALHGSPEVPGYNASHGCVRLFTEDAQWLNEKFVDLPDKETKTPGTRIVIVPHAGPSY